MIGEGSIVDEKALMRLVLLRRWDVMSSAVWSASPKT